MDRSGVENLVGTASTPYGKATYWSDRYTKDTDQFDWYQRYAGIKSIIAKYAKKKGAILDARPRVPPTRDAVPQPPPRRARDAYANRSAAGTRGSARTWSRTGTRACGASTTVAPSSSR